MKIITGILLGILAMNANASFIKQDWANTGDQLISVDTATNLAWLSPTLFFGASWNEINTRLQTDPDYNGFRFATTGEYLSLMLGENSLNLGSWAPGVEGTERFTDHFGLTGTYTQDFLSLVHGDVIYESTIGPNNAGGYYSFFSYISFAYNGMVIEDLAWPGYLDLDSKSDYRSYLLVREVPEPGTLALVLAGIAAIAVRRQRALR